MESNAMDFNAVNMRTQEFISKFSVPFTQPYDFDELIDNALFELREFTGTDRAIILEFQPDGSLLCTHGSVINEQTPNVYGRSLSYEGIKPIFDEADKTGCFYEKEASRYFEKYPATDLGEKSFCYIPLTIGGNRAGYLVFFTMFEEANWAEGEFRLATMAGSIIAGAYSRKVSEDIMFAAKESELRTQEFISKFSVPFTQPYEFDALIDNALFELRDFTGTDRAIILEFLQDGSLLCSHESVISKKTPMALGRILSYEDFKPILDEAEKTGCFYEKEASLYFAKYTATNLGEKSFCYIPLMVEGERAGYLVFFTMFEQANWAQGEFRLVTMAGSIIAGAFAIRKNDELKEAALRAQQASEAKSNFLSVMSHEIRTPMNAILGITEILLRDETVSQSVCEGLSKIQNSGNLLLNIINDILDLSKIEAGKLEINPHKYELASLINDTVLLNIMRTGSKPIEFRLFVDENLPSAMLGDELRIKQILNNLLSNAFKYTEEGEIKLDFTAEPGQDGPEDELTLVFCVSDTGQGMTETQVSAMFDEYTRFNFEANRTTEGTGLGLSIVRNLIKLMNGEIIVESELHKGSAITVRLPQKHLASDILGKELSEKLQNFQLNGDRQVKKAQFIYEPMPYGSVLIVDDVESNSFVAKGLMAPYGLNVSTVMSGFEAIDNIKQGMTYDIVFMDHMMPKMDGIEATAIIRDFGYKHPIVALTANAVSGQSERFLASGFDDFISKPIDTRQLNDILKKFVRDRHITEPANGSGTQTIDSGGYHAVEDALTNASMQLVNFFIKDALRAVSALRKLSEKPQGLDDKEIKAYTTTVHAMKSALANIGRSKLSSFAEKLEHAGNKKDLSAISADTPEFVRQLESLVNELISEKEAVDVAPATEDDYMTMREQLSSLINACGEFDRKTVKTVLTGLQQKAWPPSIDKTLDEMSESLLSGDFDNVALAAGRIIEGI